MSRLMKALKWIGIVVLFIGVVVFSLYLIYLRPVLQKMQQITTVQYDKELTIVLGGGGNSGILASDSLVIVIDTKFGDASEEFHKTVSAIAGNKPILVINTHYHSDHTGGNKYYKGQSILAGGNYTPSLWIANAKEEGMPTRWLKGTLDIPMGGDTVTVIALDRSAHTESDIFVYLRHRKLLFGGDVILNKQTPALVSSAADPDGYLYAFDMLPKHYKIEHIIPGHGEMGGVEIIDEFRQYFTDMKTAADDDSKKDELIAKYKNWTQVPIVMSPSATIKVLKKKRETH